MKTCVSTDIYFHYIYVYIHFRNIYTFFNFFNVNNCTGYIMPESRVGGHFAKYYPNIAWKD
jgi:hypothetical protein